MRPISHHFLLPQNGEFLTLDCHRHNRPLRRTGNPVKVLAEPITGLAVKRKSGVFVRYRINMTATKVTNMTTAVTLAQTAHKKLKSDWRFRFALDSRNFLIMLDFVAAFFLVRQM